MGLTIARPRTVLYVANSSKIGGGNKVLMDLMSNLDPSRFVPALVAPGEGLLVEWARAQRIPCTLSRAGDWQALAGLARRSWELARIIRQSGASIVHAAGPMCYRALGVAALATGAARVCHLGFPPEDGELERSFVAGPDAVIGCYLAQAEENRERIARIRPSCRVVGIPNGVDVARFSPGEPPRELEDLRRGASVVVAILGHISDVKGYPTFVEAAATVARMHERCVFWAIGGETMQPGAQVAMEARARQLGILERFRFLGFRHDVPDVLRAVDIVALPSLTEGFPLAVLEAMSTGKPVVATPVGGVCEAVVDGDTGFLVPPTSADALAGALLKLIDSPALRAKIGEAARARIEERYSVGAFAYGLQDVYAGLLQAEQGRIVKAASILLS